MTEWQKDSMSFKPHEFENGGKDTWIQRKNIKEVHETDPETGEVRVEYEADMRFITNKEYEALFSQRMQETNSNTVTSTANELSIMEAMADMFEMMLSMNE